MMSYYIRDHNSFSNVTYTKFHNFFIMIELAHFYLLSFRFLLTLPLYLSLTICRIRSYIYINLVYRLFIIPYLFICLTNDNASYDSAFPTEVQFDRAHGSPYTSIQPETKTVHLNEAYLLFA